MIEPVEFKFGEIEAGWCPLHISVPSQTDKVWCSAVFDPFGDLKRMMNGISYGLPESTLIDEEGIQTIIRFDVEPGAFVGRLRVYEMAYNFEVEGAIKQAHLDAQVDKIQLLAAFRRAYRDFISRYTSEDWYGDAANGIECRLDPLDLSDVETALMDVGALALSVEYLQCLDWKSARREQTIERYRNAVPNPVAAPRSIWEDIIGCREPAGSEIDLSDDGLEQLDGFSS